MLSSLSLSDDIQQLLSSLSGVSVVEPLLSKLCTSLNSAFCASSTSLLEHCKSFLILYNNITGYASSSLSFNATSTSSRGRKQTVILTSPSSSYAHSSIASFSPPHFSACPPSVSQVIGLSLAAALECGVSSFVVCAPSPLDALPVFQACLDGMDVLGYEEGRHYNIIVKNERPAQEEGKKGGPSNDDDNPVYSITRIDIFRTHRQTIQYILPAHLGVCSLSEICVILCCERLSPEAIGSTRDVPYLLGHLTVGGVVGASQLAAEEIVLALQRRGRMAHIGVREGGDPSAAGGRVPLNEIMMMLLNDENGGVGMSPDAMTPGVAVVTTDNELFKAGTSLPGNNQEDENDQPILHLPRTSPLAVPSSLPSSVLTTVILSQPLTLTPSDPLSSCLSSLFYFSFSPLTQPFISRPVTCPPPTLCTLHLLNIAALLPPPVSLVSSSSSLSTSSKDRDGTGFARQRRRRRTWQLVALQELEKREGGVKRRDSGLGNDEIRDSDESTGGCDELASYERFMTRWMALYHAWDTHASVEDVKKMFDWNYTCAGIFDKEGGGKGKNAKGKKREKKDGMDMLFGLLGQKGKNLLDDEKEKKKKKKTKKSQGNEEVDTLDSSEIMCVLHVRVHPASFSSLSSPSGPPPSFDVSPLDYLSRVCGTVEDDDGGSGGAVDGPYVQIVRVCTHPCLTGIGYGRETLRQMMLFFGGGMYDGSPPSSFLDADFLMPVSSVVPPPIDYFVCSTPLNEIVVPFILKCGMKPVFLARVDGEGARNDANNEDEDEDNRNKSKKTKNEKSKLEKNKRVMKESEMEKEEEEEEVPPTTVSAGHTSRAVRCGRWRCFFASVNSTDNGHPLDNSLYGDNLSEGSSANKNALGGDADPFPSLTQIDHPKNKLWLGRCHARFISRLYSLLSFHSIQINSSVALALLNGENSNGVRDSGGGVWPQKLDTTSALSFFLSSSSFNTSSSRHRQRSTLVHASLFTPYDLHRLSCFSRGVLSLPFVLDLLPAVSLLLLSRQTPCVLARSEAFLLLSVALQRNPLTFAARQLGIETSQAVAKLKRACGKVVWVLHRKNVHIHSS